MPDALIDSHAHVWDRSCNIVPGARYRPDYEAPIDSYLRLLDAHGVERAVLVQPSFLGTDNGYLLSCLREHPDRLRGIAVIDPGTSADRFDDLAADGVIGLRYNLLSLPPERLRDADYRALTADAAARGWWIEVQANGGDWPLVLSVLGDVHLMVDHFGRPDAQGRVGSTPLADRPPDRTVVKLSAPYRLSRDDVRSIAREFIARYGAQRCLWGSDWPWTQHEDRHSYRDTIDWLDEWLSREEHALLCEAAPGHLGF